jgi:glutathione-regulated potassium-efflux system ancillary protein KefG
MRTLVIVAHPNIERSRVNRCWIEELGKYPDVTIHDLYRLYPDGDINIYFERELIIKYNRIVFQFPLFWFGPPYLVKKWQDEVLTYLWSGMDGLKLRGKELYLAVSIGAPEESYRRNGFNQFTIEELFRPFQAMANLTGMRMMPIFKFFNANLASDREILISARQYAMHILEPSYMK